MASSARAPKETKRGAVAEASSPLHPTGGVSAGATPACSVPHPVPGPLGVLSAHLNGTE